MITPTVGRMVWYRPNGSLGATCAAVICGVNTARNVNLCVFDLYGAPMPRTSVPLVQEGDVPPDGAYAEWMPYQKAVASGAQAPTLHATKEQP